MARSNFRYYSVARGHRPGIYTQWSDCTVSVTRFSGSKYKGHQTLEQAKHWMRDHNAGQFAFVIEEAAPPSRVAVPRIVQPVVQAARPVSSPYTSAAALIAQQPPSDVVSSQGFRASWKTYRELSPEFKFQLSQEVAASQGVNVKPKHVDEKDVEQEYERRRTRAMHNALQIRFFDNATSELAGYQALCRAIRIEPSDTIKDCCDDLRGTLVNICDLLDALEFDEPVKLWPLEDWPKFAAYTKEPANRFNLGEAKKSKYLQCFLQKLSRVAPVLSGNPRPLQSRGERDLATPAPMSPEYGAEVKEEVDYEGVSERMWDYRAGSSLAATESRKRGAREIKDEEMDEKTETKRLKLMYTYEVNTVRSSSSSSEDTKLGMFEDIVQSGHKDNPVVIEDSTPSPPARRILQPRSQGVSQFPQVTRTNLDYFSRNDTPATAFSVPASAQAIRAVPPAAEEEREQSRKIYSILNCQKKGRGHRYEVKWSSTTEATWESAGDLKMFKKELREFHAEHPDKPEPTWLAAA